MTTDSAPTDGRSRDTDAPAGDPSRTAALLPIEIPHHRRPSPRRVLADLGPRECANALIALIFSATGPVAVILAAGEQGGLTPQELSSWIFGVFFANGVR